MADKDRRSARGFLTRLPGLDVVGRRILDVHCHHDDLCLLLAEQGAREVVGVATCDLAEARANLRRAPPEVQDRIRLQRADSSAEWLQEAPYDLVISRGGLGGATGADAHVARLRAALAPEGTIVIEFSPRRRTAPRGDHHGLTLETFADVMARSRLHCTWYRVRRVTARAPILRMTVLSVWRQPLYDR